MERLNVISRMPKRRILLLVLLILGAWLLFKGWRLYVVARSLEGHVAQAQALTIGEDTAAVEALITGVRGDVKALKWHTRPFMFLTPLLKPLPKVGGLAAEAPDLMEIADAGTSAAVTLLPEITEAWGQIDNTNASLLAQISPIVNSVTPALTNVEEEVVRITTAYNEIGNRDKLPYRVRELLPMVDLVVPLADDGLVAAKIAPELLGTNGRRTFIVLAQNPWELRATGGFISGVGRLVIENGEIIEFDFSDAELVNLRPGRIFYPDSEAYGEAPEPLYYFMGLSYWLFLDSNFSPDFPTSAQKALDLYALGQDIEADGVVAIDLYTVEMLIGALGEIPLSDGSIIDETNVIGELQESWSQRDAGENEDLAERKNFLGELSNILLGTLTSGDDPESLARVVAAMFDAAERRHLQIYMKDPAAQEALSQLGWDNPIKTNPGGDIVHVVETNVGYNKVNAIITREMAYAITLHDDAPHESQLTLKYNNDSYDDGSACTQFYVEYASADYSELLARCYYNYARFYLPPTTRFVSESIAPVSTRIFDHDRGIPREDSGWPGGINLLEETADHAQFETFFLVPKGSAVINTVTYTQTHTVIDDDEYSLIIPKQAGLQTINYTVSVTLPERARVNRVIANHPITSINEKTLTFELQSDRDIHLVIEW